MSLLNSVFGPSPFGPLLEHAKKVHECVHLITPLMQAMQDSDYEEVRRLQDQVSKLEYEADVLSHEIREHLPRRYFLPVEREDLDSYLELEDGIADAVEDFAVTLIIRHTRIHEQLKEEFTNFVGQVVSVADTLMAAAEEMQNLAETSFGGSEADSVLKRIQGLGEEEWKADRMQRQLSIRIYEHEQDLDTITILFYEKMLHTLSRVANNAENTGDMLRSMIVKGK